MDDKTERKFVIMLVIILLVYLVLFVLLMDDPDCGENPCQGIDPSFGISSWR